MACPGPHICMPSLYSPELWVLLRESRIRSVVEAVCVSEGGVGVRGEHRCVSWT